MLEQFIESLELRHFAPIEFINPGGNPHYTDPPQRLWPNIVATAVVLDALREDLARPIRLTSVYRSPLHNADADGGDLSNHLAFTAADFQVLEAGRVLGRHQVRAQERLLQWRGRRFESRGRVPHRVGEVVAAGRIPFAELPTWDSRHEPVSTLLEFHGGLGRYRSFTHVDTRGLDHTWNGSA